MASCQESHMSSWCFLPEDTKRAKSLNQQGSVCPPPDAPYFFGSLLPSSQGFMDAISMVQLHKVYSSCPCWQQWFFRKPLLQAKCPWPIWPAQFCCGIWELLTPMTAGNLVPLDLAYPLFGHQEATPGRQIRSSEMLYVNTQSQLPQPPPHCPCPRQR